MKKIIFIALTMMVSLAASAQYSAPFVIYTPITGGSNGSNSNNLNSNNYGGYNPFGYDSYSMPGRSHQQQESQVLSTRGYYKKNGQLCSVLIRVQVRGNDVYVVGIKKSSVGWTNTQIKAETLLFDELKDHFDYYVHDYSYGRIYF